jgi:hypothetical protein
MAGNEEETFGQIILKGVKTYFGSTSANVTVYVLIKDDVGDVLYCKGETKPTDGLSGFAKGCIFIDTDVADNSQGVYFNIGTNTSAEFSLNTSAAAD